MTNIAKNNINIANADFMRDEHALRIIRTLNKDKPDVARFVGGCVRDAILGRPTNDIDIATKLTPTQVMALLNANNITHVPTGIQHGTISAILGKRAFEITTLRKDVETDGRRAVVEFSQDWADDVMRRDFTINALYSDIDGNIYDLLDGISDINNKIIRFVGDAELRIREDYLRILRFYRFYAQLPDFSIDITGHKACRKLHGGIRTLSSERIWSEFKKILWVKSPNGVKSSRDVLMKMADDGVLFNILPFRAHFDVYDYAANGDYLNRLMALMPKSITIADDVAEQLRMSNIEAKRIQEWACANNIITHYNYKSEIYYNSKQYVLDLYFTQKPDTELYGKINEFSKPQFPINGEDLKKIGFASGVELGQTLKRLELEWVQSDFTLLREELLLKAQ